MPAAHAAIKRGTRRKRVILWSAIALVLILLAAAAWVAIRALLAKSDLEAASDLASTVQDDIVAGQKPGAALDQLASHVHSAESLTGDPIWRAAENVPLLGPSLSAVREMSAVLANVTDEAIQPLAAVAGSIQLSDLKPVQGRVDVKPLIDAQPAVASADQALDAGIAQIRRIDTSDVFSFVGEAIDQVQTMLVKADAAVTAVDHAVTLIPAMVGDEGARNYLVLLQNNAELRSTGGITGALALIHTDHGRIELTKQATSGDFPHYEEPVLDLPVDTRGIYGDIAGEYIQDVNLTPRFPLSAKLASEMWKRQYGLSVDGVLSFDPVALSYLLKATGPIDLPTGDVLNSGNAVKLLLSDVYQRYANPSDQDAFFAAAASAVFEKVASGELDSRSLITALAEAGGEHRILLWSAHADEQKLLAGTTLADVLPPADAAKPTFGVYLNDATGAKMDYYLDVQLGVGQEICRQDGRESYTVEVTLTNTVDSEAVATLPRYVTGGGAFGVEPGNIRTNVAVYGPTDTLYLGATRDGDDVGLHSAMDEGHPLGQFQVELTPGQSVSYRLQFLGGAAKHEDPVIFATPGVSSYTIKNVAVGCKLP